MRNIAILMALHDITIAPIWIPSKENVLADMLSRGLWDKIAERVPPASSTTLTCEPPPSWYAEIPLPRQAARYLWWGLAAKTRETYQSAQKSYVSSCRIAGVPPFPASLFNLARWIAELGIRNLQAKTIKSYLAAVRSFQVDIGATSVELKMFSHPTLFRTIAGIRRMNGEENTVPLRDQFFCAFFYYLT